MHAEVMFPPLPAALKPGFAAFAWLLRHGVIASLPHWQRDLGNVNHAPVLDVVIPPALKAIFAALDKSAFVKVRLLGILSPQTVPIAGPMLLGIEPRSDEVLTPAEAFRRHRVRAPRELYEELRHSQSKVLFTPSAPLSAQDAAAWAVDRAA
jgi:hypothetical protein